ncbi:MULTISPECIES: recombinase family protein [unclassified Frankia]|uniref:recombinase family protein n=1 Tax=unclassified Frankia TaxID=2632575 RepID=UPI002AD2E0D7|nr:MULTISPECIES: recombinase family protein [unclassified Frankia]
MYGRCDLNRLHAQLTDHARTEGMSLAEVFVDRCVPPGRLVRPGLNVLLDTVLRTGGDVLVLDADHLSSLPAVRRAIEVEIEVLGARLHTVTAPGTDQRHAKPWTPPGAWPTTA